MKADIERRLLAAEATQRRFHWYAGGLCLAMLALAGEGILVRSRPRVIEAERFVVRSRRGAVLAEFGIAKRGGTPSLVLKDSKGRNQAGLEIERDGSSSLTFSERGTPLLELSADPDGSAAFRLHSQDDLTRAGISQDGRGRAVAEVVRNRASVRIGLDGDRAAGLIVTDADGRGLAVVGTPELTAAALDRIGSGAVEAVSALPQLAGLVDGR